MDFELLPNVFFVTVQNFSQIFYELYYSKLYKKVI
jgi:hypothetical protein